MPILRQAIGWRFLRALPANLCEHYPGWPAACLSVNRRNARAIAVCRAGGFVDAGQQLVLPSGSQLVMKLPRGG